MKIVRTFEIESWLEGQDIEDERDAIFFNPDFSEDEDFADA